MGKYLNSYRWVAFISTFAILGGCSTYKIDRSIQPSEADVIAIRKEINHVREFQQAVYDVSIFAADRCDVKIGREPFVLMTLGHLDGNVSKQRIAAYYQAAGLDETWRVLWADDSSPLKTGDRVLEINGNRIENNKSGLGEYPLAKYILQTSRARDAAFERTPFVITLENGKTLTIPTRPACRTQVFAMPVFDAKHINSSLVPTALHGALTLPPSAIHAARTTDEYRYLAGIAVYLSASSEAHNRRRSAGLLMGLGALASVAIPPLYSVISPAAVKSGNAIAGGDMSINSALFSSQIIHDMGGDPRAGLTLLSRLESQKLEPPLVALSPEQEKVLEAFIDGLSAIKSSSPAAAQSTTSN
jgi:hypothetical protein